MYFAYILLNEAKTKTYSGHTSDLKNRLAQHNGEKGAFSKNYGPWKILYSEKFETEIEAIKREEYFKCAAGRRWIKNNFFK